MISVNPDKIGGGIPAVYKPCTDCESRTIEASRTVIAQEDHQLSNMQLCFDCEHYRDDATTEEMEPQPYPCGLRPKWTACRWRKFLAEPREDWQDPSCPVLVQLKTKKKCGGCKRAKAAAKAAATPPVPDPPVQPEL